MDDISRFEMHKKLKTWHFDLNSTKQDYNIVKHINKPNSFWENGLKEILTQEKQDLTNGFLSKGTKKNNNVNEQAISSLSKDVKMTQAPSDDNWFERRKILKDHIFYELLPDYLEYADIRIARQNPMDMTYRHIDHEHQQVVSSREGEDNFYTIEEAFKSRGKWVKYIILIEDLQPGQVFYWGNSIVKAKRGDMFEWDYAVPHWTVNFSDKPRHSIMITGKKK